MAQTHYPTLFVICNSDSARWIDIEEDRAQEKAEMHETMERYSDREGQFGSGKNGSKAGEPDVMNARRYDHLLHHLRHVAKTTAEYWKSSRYTSLSVAIPEQLKHQFEKELHRYLPNVPLRELYGNFIHLSAHAVRGLYEKQWKPQ